MPLSMLSNHRMYIGSHHPIYAKQDQLFHDNSQLQNPTMSINYGNLYLN